MHLDADYRWCLTGTPVRPTVVHADLDEIVNKLEDLFPLLRWIRMAPWHDWTHFRDQITKVEKRRPQVACERVREITKRIMLRRTKDSKLNGHPLIELPAKTVNTPSLEFDDPEELEFYTALQARMQARVSKFLKAGVLRKNWACAFESRSG